MLLRTPSSWTSGQRHRLGDTPGQHVGNMVATRRHCRIAAHSAGLTGATNATVGQALSEREALLLRDSIVVMGAGPAGLATAAALQSVGLPAVVVDRDAQLSTAGTALGLWTNAWRALEVLQAAEPLRTMHPRVDRVELCRSSGRTLRSFSIAEECDGGPHEFRGVRRASLLRALAARLAPGTLLLGCPVMGVEPTPQGATLQLGAGGGDGAGGAAGHSVECLAVVGADGARSVAAAAAGRGQPRYVGQTAIRGIAAYPDGVPCRVIRQVWGEGPRAGMYPISDTELYWFVCWNAPADAPIPASPEGLREEALRQVQGWGWQVEDIIRRTPAEDLTRSRIVDRWDLPGGSSGGAVTLAGDALHPMTPNLGQGGCTALEDAVVLARMLRERSMAQVLPAATRCVSVGCREAAVQLLANTFREYERERAERALPITVRSFGMGALLQLGLPPVVATRDLFVERLFSPSHFLDHATYDCGSLEESVPAIYQ